MKNFRSFLHEQQILEKVTEHLEDFLEFACDYLDIDSPPEIELIPEKSDAQQNSSFGGYIPSEGKIRVNIAERHRADVYRTLAHELVHHKQNLDGRLDEDSGRTGSDIENEANAIAGIIMRNYARENGQSLFESVEPVLRGTVKHSKAGGVTTVHRGRQMSFPLHPHHKKAIAKLEHTDSTKLHLETGHVIRATRDEDMIHLEYQNYHTIVPRSEVIENH
jgi:hypothetical protein